MEVFLMHQSGESINAFERSRAVAPGFFVELHGDGKIIQTGWSECESHCLLKIDVVFAKPDRR